VALGGLNRFGTVFAKTKANIGENNMQPSDAYVQNDRPVQASRSANATQQLEDILSRGLAPFYRSAYRLLGNSADAEDAVQDALFSAYKHVDQFRGQSQMSTWLTAVVRNSARMQLRKRPRQSHVSLDEQIGDEQDYSVADRLSDGRPSPEDECRGSELNAHVSKFATRLSPTLRRTFQLRDMEDLSIHETASILGLANGTVKAQLSRARKKLRTSVHRESKTQARILQSYTSSSSFAAE
jgi:RNA polymerase sigma-70 factor (ECF subfamily)